MRLYYFSTYFSADSAKGGRSEYLEKNFQSHSLGLNLDVVLDSAKGGKSEYLEKDFQSHSLGFVLNLVLTAPALCAGLA